jgi:hypothetical protein
MHIHVVAFLPRVRPEIAPRALGKRVGTSGESKRYAEFQGLKTISA